MSLGVSSSASQACRAALDWASQLAVVAAEAQLPAVAARVGANCPGEAAAVLAQAATPGEEVVALLQYRCLLRWSCPDPVLNGTPLGYAPA